MEVRELLNVLHIAERLKDELRHCETSKGRRESVAACADGIFYERRVPDAQYG